MNHRRRGSVTQQALAGLFRSNSTTANSNLPPSADASRRRLSISTTSVGLTGTSPTNPNAFSSFRRGSMSTNSDSIDEHAIDEDEPSRTAPVTPFTRRMSFGAPAMRMRNGSGSPGSNGNHPSAPTNASSHKTPASNGRRSSVNPRGVSAGASPSQDQDNPASPALSIAAVLSSSGRRLSTPAQASTAPTQRKPSDTFIPRPDQGFNWSEQLRSRAESSVQGTRPSFSFGSSMSSVSPQAIPQSGGNHDRAKSVSDMPVPPAQATKPKAPEPQRKKPDAFQERILKGDFYMD